MNADLIIRSQKRQERSNPPLLALCIPTWNRADALKLQLNQIAQSLGAAVDVIVVDNGSDDYTWDCLCTEAKVNRLAITCYRNKFNIGVTANTLRALEASSAEWTWIIGDRHKLDFACIGTRLLTELPEARSDLLMLLDKGEINTAWCGADFLDIDSFMQPESDYLGVLFYQVSRVVVRTVAAQRLLIQAYKYGMADLHAFAHTYAPLIAASGLTILSADLFRRDDSASDVTRWDLIEGHIGAWKSSLLLFQSHHSLAAKRERRLRSGWLFDAFEATIKSGKDIDLSAYLFALRHLSNRSRLRLLSLAGKELFRKGFVWNQSRSIDDSGY